MKYFNSERNSGENRRIGSKIAFEVIVKWSCYENIVIQFGFIGAQFLRWMDVALDGFIGAEAKNGKRGGRQRWKWIEREREGE